MSHNHAGHVPYITSHTTALSTAGAGQTLAITGFGLSLATTVDIPADLGVETSRSYAKSGPTSGTLTITLTVAEVPSTGAVNYSVSISMGGVPAQGPDVTAGAITVAHGFSPTDLSSLVAWYDETSITYDANLYNRVSQWSDKSGNGYHAVQSTSSYRPQYVASGGGIGQPHVSFGWNNGRDFLQTSQTVTWGPVSSGGFANASVFAVLHHPGTAAPNYTSDIFRSVPTSDSFGISPHPYRSGMLITRGSNYYCVGGTSANNLPTEFLAGWLYTDTGFVTRLNGSVDKADSSSPPTSARSGLITLGAHNGTGSHLEASEILVFSTELTGTDLSNVEGYLNGKWSIY